MKLKVLMSVNIRSVPTTAGNDAIGVRQPNEEINAEQIHVERYNRVWAKDKKGWSAIVHDGTVFMRGQ